jgi:hypothetical protein
LVILCSGIPGSDACSSESSDSELCSEDENSDSDAQPTDVDASSDGSDAELAFDDEQDAAARHSAFKPQTFGNFEELKEYVENVTKVKMSNNKRTIRFDAAPVWFKDAFPSAEVCWLNGTLYCHQPKKEEYEKYFSWAKTMCTCKVRYALCSQTKLWRITEFDDCHNHNVKATAETSATGIIHIRNAARLDQDMIVTIKNWLDANQSDLIMLLPFIRSNADTL